MADLEKKYPKLHYCLMAYFHQDWQVVVDWKGNAPNFDEVVRFYKSHIVDNRGEKEQVTNELRNLLAVSTEEELKQFNRSASVYVHMPSYGITNRQWLEGILKVLEEPGNETYLKWDSSHFSESRAIQLVSMSPLKHEPH
jgi:hypothetical protein